MRIALFGGAEYPIPPPPTGIYAPLTIVSQLADGLCERGHDVTLFAPRGSKSKAKIVDLNMEPLDNLRRKNHEPYELKTLVAYEQIMTAKIYNEARRGSFDVIHSHSALRTLPYAPMADVPTILTMHTPVKKTYSFAYEAASKRFKYYAVSISRAQMKQSFGVSWAGTVYNGLELAHFPFAKKSSEGMLWIGRIHPDKGTKDAITIAKKMRKHLALIGATMPEVPASLEYWEKIKKEIRGEDIKHYGMIPHREVSQNYQIAKVMFFPIHWEEPFGLVMIEAMACGTPVVAYARGSVPEIIEDGKTGYIVNASEKDIRGRFTVKKTGLRGFEEAVRMIYEMSPAEYGKMRMACREHVVKKFTVEKMVEGYEQLYKKVLFDYKKVK